MKLYKLTWSIKYPNSGYSGISIGGILESNLVYNERLYSDKDKAQETLAKLTEAAGILGLTTNLRSSITTLDVED